ncbi:sirohydrochlorin chelatase [Corynebacterium kozikiae]|uniref:sirohydrochlorin chelatase n=1 Tax=Corynebacterium kozikiae TaxID=2968469 RepID=UPI00211BF419|nr:CbiX/SirB N-terminal domain-containing protein [Corynebacterium sp. 76QC2CO]MCQ9342917.1 sirohydrochlorin chelatase [Corynebacterium sp. 76QC2CO]MCQ9371442.1 sirohydrochlorin chelatase [Corynebacterium sp. 35RC1]
MTALILLSHGSRHPHADAGVEALAAAVEEPAFVAHLDFSGQDLQHTAGLVHEAGHREAIVVPLLFTHAFHARFDVPRVVREAEEALGLALHISAGLGTGVELAEVLRPTLSPEPGVLNVLYSVGSSVEEANQAVDALASSLGMESVAATRGGVAALEALRAQHGSLHVVPLFVTHGLLLDQVIHAELEGVTVGEPLGARLAPVVEQRYRECLAGLRER